MDKLIKQLRENIHGCGLDMGAGWDNFQSVSEAQSTLDKLEKAINDLKSNTTDLKRIVFKKGSSFKTDAFKNLDIKNWQPPQVFDFGKMFKNLGK